MRTERWGLAALLAVTVVWGTTFPAMKLLSAQLDALQIIWLRFVVALVVLAPLWRGMLRPERRWGCALGVLLFLAFWLQIEGLARTSSNRNAFVTGLSVLVVPLIAMAALGRRYGWRLWAACLMALAGMALAARRSMRSTSTRWKNARGARHRTPCGPRAWPPRRPP
jgi:drug/metabolite transporter (DMT)-like permease